MTYCTIVIPNRDRHGVLLRPDVLHPCIRETVDQLVTWFGGCTVLRGIGHWRNAAGVLMVERVRILCVYGDWLPNHAARDLKSLATDVARRIDQETVLYSVNHAHYFAGGSS